MRDQAVTLHLTHAQPSFSGAAFHRLAGQHRHCGSEGEMDIERRRRRQVRDSDIEMEASERQRKRLKESWRQVRDSRRDGDRDRSGMRMVTMMNLG